MVIIAGSVFYTNLLVQKFASEERKNVKLWADAVHRKARLVRYTESFFTDLQDQEREKVELLADVYRQILKDNPDEDLTFYLNIITNNKTIPIVVADQDGLIIDNNNLEINLDTNNYMVGKLKDEFSTYKPIEIPYTRVRKNYLYYKDSRFFTELKAVLNDYVSSFMSEVAFNSSSVPVIITDSSKTNVVQFGNLNDIKMSDPQYVTDQLEEMAGENTPIKVSFGEQGTSFIFYKDSELLTIMKFFPIAQILIIAVFLAIAYLLFSYSRRAEQNRVWAGMAKETAHQLGTPLSSIMAWIELLKMREGTEEASEEIEKDIERLEIITERFSKIGSVPKLNENDIVAIIVKSIDYLKPRTPKKISYTLNLPDKAILLPIDGPLFSWVIENICKNAIDAMSASGNITIDLKEESKSVVIDFIDNGKGISITEQKAIFNPGYTRKKRGWGLGLSLAKRIIRDYHKGKIFVKSSVIGKGTTFRVILKKSND